MKKCYFAIGHGLLFTAAKCSTLVWDPINLVLISSLYQEKIALEQEGSVTVAKSSIVSPEKSGSLCAFRSNAISFEVAKSFHILEYPKFVGTKNHTSTN